MDTEGRGNVNGLVFLYGTIHLEKEDNLFGQPIETGAFSSEPTKKVFTFHLKLLEFLCTVNGKQLIFHCNCTILGEVVI